MRTTRTTTETVESATPLRIEVNWQPQNLEGRVRFVVADRVLDDAGELRRLESERPYGMRLDALRATTLTRADGSTVTGAQIEADLLLVLTHLQGEGVAAEAKARALAEAQAVEAQRLQAEADRIQREAQQHNTAAQAATERMQAEQQALDAELAGKPRREG